MQLPAISFTELIEHKNRISDEALKNELNAEQEDIQRRVNEFMAKVLKIVEETL
jgi:hypothetical protein